MESKFLVFENLPFKLMVIEKLMYERRLLGEPYNAADEFFERYEAYCLTATEEEQIKIIEKYISRGVKFFTELEIPCSLASEITELYSGEELKVYSNINPQWLDLRQYEDGAMFTVTDISEREIKQFPKLKRITFNMYRDPPDTLLSKLEAWGIEVNPQD